MTYPLSSIVSAGDATLATHYNNLRSDALLLGKAAADAVPLGALLERYESRLKIARLNTDQVRIEASSAAPVSLLVGGFMLQAVANVDLAVDQKPSGSASTFYIFANRAAASTTFTLSVSTSATEGAAQRRIGRFYWDGSTIEKDSVRTELAVLTAELLYLVEPHLCEGRLTLSTGVPVPAGDVASSSNLYFTPFVGSRVALYVPNYGWRVYAFSELTYSVGAVAANKNVDIFIYNNAGSLALEGVQWSNDTLRATALTRQDGVLVRSGAPSYRYLGTIRTSGAGVTADTKLKRFVWNYYNRVERSLQVIDTTDSWTYAAVTTWRALNNSTANRVEVVIGLDETLVKLSAHVLGENTGNNGFCVGICLDNTNGTNAGIMRGMRGVTNPSNFNWYGADYYDHPGIGYHYLQLTEYSQGGTTTFYGDKGTSPEVQSGAVGSLAV